MNQTDSKYSRFALTREMLQTPGILASFDVNQAADAADAVARAGKLFMTGEGSSRFFPACNAIDTAMSAGAKLCVAADSSCCAARYPLDDWVVFAASNSGRTQEVVSLVEGLKARGHANCFALTATPDSKLEAVADRTYVISCGSEDAVAATKSLMEQAMFYQSLVALACGTPAGATDEMAQKVETALTCDVPEEITAAVAEANIIYFVGCNDGVAAELTLKANEVVRKKSDFLEGTYPFHGPQEVMDAGDVVILIDPVADQQSRYADIMARDIGMKLFAVSSRQTQFPTLSIPDAGAFNSFVQLAAGWNILVEGALALDIDLDHPQRASKVADDCADPDAD